MRINGKHACGECNKSEPQVQFQERIVNGRRYKRHLCKGCFNHYTNKIRISTETGRKSIERRRKRRNEKVKLQRLNNEETEKFIYWDSRNRDKKLGLDNDLTKEFIKTLISKPCSYCKGTTDRMSIDRVDNSVGHIQTNVVGCCISCNLLRGNLPYEAWKLLVPGIRKARKLGLLDDWKARYKFQGVG